MKNYFVNDYKDKKNKNYDITLENDTIILKIINNLEILDLNNDKYIKKNNNIKKIIIINENNNDLKNIIILIKK